MGLVPDIRTGGIYDLTAERLARLGVRVLLLDLDNTLSRYRVTEPTAELLSWRGSLTAAGITPYIVSNNRSGRARVFAERAGLGCIDRAGKPKPGAIRRAMALCGGTERDTALCGDQIFTDILGASRAGIRSILVRPISLKNPFRALRWLAETPFRLGRREE